MSEGGVARRILVDSCSSTQDLAWQYVPPCFVLARSQQAGRGRGAGRDWHSPAGGVYLSYHFLVEDPLGLSLLGGLAAVRCVRRLGLSAWLKWPNDVYLEGRKLAGVLPDVRWSGQQCQGAVLGVGLNVRVDDLPPEACSLHEWLSDVQVESLGEALMDELEGLVTRHRQLGLRGYLEEVRQCSLPVGTLVEYSLQGRLCQGRVLGLHEQGWLLLEGQPALVQVDWLRAPHFLPPARVITGQA